MRQRRMIPLAAAITAAALLAGCASIPRRFYSRDQQSRPFELVEGDPMYRILKPGLIRPVDDPRWLSVAAAEEQMQDQEPVIVYVQDGERRVYSTWLLNAHEVVNDVVGETPIAVTW